MVVASNEFKEAFDKVKIVVGRGNIKMSDEEIVFLLNYTQQLDNPISHEVIVPRSYVDDFVQTCFDNHPLLKIELEDKFINGTSEREPIGLLNERNDIT